MNNKEYIEKWLNGTLNSDELAVFEQTDTFRELVKIDTAMQAFKAPDFDVEAELARLKQRREKKGQVVVFPMLRQILRVAAVVLIAITAYFYFYLNANTTLQTAGAEKNTLYLPDSSMVAVNAMSRVGYKKNIWKYSRTVQLDGEAFFKVAKGSRFDVMTDAGVVTVLGTQFNVKHRDDYFEVECFEGMVQVSAQNQVNQLAAGSGFRILNGDAQQFSTAKSTTPAWMENESVFQSVSVRLVLNEFERQYNVEILAEGLDLDKLFTGKFRHNDMQQALQAITLPLNLQYKIADKGQIILSARGE